MEPGTGLQVCVCVLTFAASLHLSHGCQGVGQKVREAAVQIDRCQATLEALAGVDQLGQVSVHLFGDAPDVQVTWWGLILFCLIKG